MLGSTKNTDIIAGSVVSGPDNGFEKRPHNIKTNLAIKFSVSQVYV